MPLAVRFRDTHVASLEPLEGLHAVPVEDAVQMALLQDRTVEEMHRRFEAGHRAWVALLHDQPAAWGWAATRRADIGELGTSFEIAPTDRYLWNFVTLAPYRGLGIYPRLIETIVAAESDAERFWIAWAPENHASGAGIRKAGFVAMAELSFDGEGEPAVYALENGGGALAARVLGIREVPEALAQCWRCVRAGRGGHYCRPHECRCDYQQPAIACHT
jgi:GNAT superfamily N-acetyltransferase